MKPDGFSKEWHQYVAENRRRAMLEILQEISRLYRLHRLPFILIGAASLLIRGCLRYTAWWDLDLLFQSPRHIETFRQIPKRQHIQIFPIDEKLVDYGYLSSLQTMWGVYNIWYRVDYIFHNQLYEFHSLSPEESNLYQDTIHWRGEKYQLFLPVAHPWNIFIDKLLSSRLEYELQKGDAYSIDIRHLFILLDLYHREPDFWDYLSRKLSSPPQKEKFKHNLQLLLQKKDDLGYRELDLKDQNLQFLRKI